MKYLILILSILCSGLFAQDNIKLNKYIEDQNGLLSYSFEKRMENYLDKFYQSSEIKLHVLYLQSLQGKDAETFNDEVLKRYDPSERVILLTLSLSDRLFNISRSESLSDDIPLSKVNSMIDILVPYIKAGRYEQSVSIFSDIAIFSVDSNYKLSPPPVMQKQFVGTKGLIFFLIIFILVILLGRKFFTSTILFSSNQSKSKRKYLSGGW